MSKPPSEDSGSTGQQRLEEADRKKDLLGLDADLPDPALLLTIRAEDITILKEIGSGIYFLLSFRLCLSTKRVSFSSLLRLALALGNSSCLRTGPAVAPWPFVNPRPPPRLLLLLLLLQNVLLLIPQGSFGMVYAADFVGTKVPPPPPSLFLI